jgi:hypothetical protein
MTTLEARLTEFRLAPDDDTLMRASPSFGLRRMTQWIAVPVKSKGTGFRVVPE